MDQRLKERLIGAVVLVALAVWLIPWLLDGPEQAPGTETVALELPTAEESAPVRTVTIDLDERARPEVPTEGAAAPEAAGSASAGAGQAADEGASEPAAPPGTAPAAARATPEAASSENASSAGAARTGTAEPAAETERSEPAAAGDWTVQLGAFGEAANAERLAKRVETFGYAPEVSRYTASGRDMHRVRVGPQPSRARAEAVASALSAHGFVAQVVTAD